MTYRAQDIAIESRFYSNWGTATPVKWGNVDFTPPENSAFVEVFIDNVDEIPTSLGDTVLYRNFGLISINIHVPLNSARANLNNYCDTAAVIFRGQQFSGVTCRGARITNLGEVNGRYVSNVLIEFFRDEAF